MNDLIAESRAKLAADIARAKWASIKADLAIDVLAYGPDLMRSLLEQVIEDMPEPDGESEYDEERRLDERDRARSINKERR